MTLTERMQSRAGDQRGPLVPVGDQRPIGHSGGGASPDERNRAEARVLWLRGERCKPSPRGLWSGYHCPKDKELQRAYGFGCEWYWTLYVEQGEGCAVCGNPPGQADLVVDENPTTREIRGLLHRGCNGKISDPISRYLADPPAARIGGHVVEADRFARRLRRQEAKRRARRAKTAATAKALPAPSGDYAANLAALREGRGKA